MPEAMSKISGMTARQSAPLLVSGALITNLVGSNTILTFTMGIFISTFHAEFGWSRADIAFAMTCFTLVAFFGSAAIGRLADRFAPGRIAALSMLGFGIGLIIAPVLIHDVKSLWMTYIFLAIVGLGTSPVVTNRQLIAALSHRKGLAVGLAMTGSGLGGFFLPRFTAELVRIDGWAAAFTGLGCLACLAAPLIWFALGRQRDERASGVSGAAPISQRPSFSTLLRKPPLWILSAVAVLGGLGMSGPAAHLIPLFEDHLISVGDAAAYASTLGLASIAGRIVTGLVLDRFKSPIGAFVILVAGATGICLLGQFDFRTVLFAVIPLGFVIGAEVVMLAIFVGRYSNPQSHGVAFGWVYGVMAFGSAIGPVAVGTLRDSFGDYDLAMTLSGGALAAAGVACLLLGFYRTEDAAR